MYLRFDGDEDSIRFTFMKGAVWGVSPVLQCSARAPAVQNFEE
jgi:hypothetical protein